MHSGIRSIINKNITMLCEEKFNQIYGREAKEIAFCPYRICPIGAHSDHNLGKITGLAINKGIHIAYGPKQNGIIDKIPETEAPVPENVKEAEIEIKDIRVYTVGGESVFYITASDGQIYKQSIARDERVIILKPGDKLKVKYELPEEVTDGGDPLVKQISFFSFIIDTEETPAATESGETEE